MYRSGTEGEFGSPSRVYNTSQLAASACPANAEGVRHFVITLEDHGNSSVSPIVWGAVVGCEGREGCEQFTARELIEFPIYIWRNHSSYWTGLPWWLTLCNFFLAIIAVMIVTELLRLCFATECWIDCARGSFCGCWTRCCGRICCCFFTEEWSIKVAGTWRVFDVSGFLGYRSQAAGKDGESSTVQPVMRITVREREGVYGVAVLGWSWAMLDMTVHYFICLTGEDLSDDPGDLAFSHGGFWGGVIAWSNLVPLTITLLCWWGTRPRFGPDKRFGLKMYAWWTRPDVWAPLEILTGISWFFNFGAGYYVGPSATILAGMVRLNEVRNVKRTWPVWLWQSLKALIQRCTPQPRVMPKPIGEVVVQPAAQVPKDQAFEEVEALLPAMFLRA